MHGDFVDIDIMIVEHLLCLRDSRRRRRLVVRLRDRRHYVAHHVHVEHLGRWHKKERMLSECHRMWQTTVEHSDMASF